MRRILRSCAAAMVVGALVLVWSSVASAQPCMIFVHGKQTDTNTFTNWNSARNYWKNGSNDFVQAATKNFATSYYVVGYNGTRPYYESQSAGEVANEIVNATNGGADGGGNHCARTYAQGGTFWVIAHSMGGTDHGLHPRQQRRERPELQLHGSVRPGGAAHQHRGHARRRAPRLARRRRGLRQRQHLLQLHRVLHPELRRRDLLAAERRRGAGANGRRTPRRATSI